MGIFSRFTDIINSNINALLDKAENPEKMVRLIIQEMEDTLVEVRSTSAKTLAERKDLQRRLQRIQDEVKDWEDKATLALTKGREDLAKAALLEKSKVSEQAEAIERELDSLNEQLEKLQQETSQLQEKLADAKNRQKAIVLRQQSATTRLEVKKQLDGGKINDAMERFERYESKIDSVEAQVEAYDMGKRSLADEISQLENDSKVDDELAALKAKLNAKSE
jgi:phage shock protein A